MDDNSMRTTCAHHAEVMLTLLNTGKLTYADVDKTMGFKGKEKELSHQLLKERISKLKHREVLEMRIAHADALDRLSRQRWLVATYPPWGSYACQTVVHYTELRRCRLQLTGYEDIFIAKDLANHPEYGPYIVVDEAFMLRNKTSSLD